MRVLCVLLLWLTAFPFPAAASSSVPPETHWRCYRDSSDENPTGWANTEPACVVKYCQWRGNSSPGGSTPWTACESTGTGRGVRYQVGGGGAWYTDGLYAQTRQACPSGSVLKNGVCEPTPPACPAGYEEEAGQCVPVNQCVAGEAGMFLAHTGWGLTAGPGNLSRMQSLPDAQLWASVSQMCSGGCLFKYDPLSPVNGGAENDPNVYWKPNQPVGIWTPIYDNLGYKGTGQSCTPGDGAAPFSPAPGAEPPPNPTEGPDKAPENAADCAKKGGYWGQVNGVDKCVQKAPDSGAGGAPKPTDGTQSGNPSQPASAPAVTNNNNGSTGSGGAGGGSGPGHGTGPGSGTGSGSGSGSGPSGAASGPTGSASSPLNVTIKCQDLGTCPDANAGGGLPQRPKLWESKYPDGVAGVWNQRVGELKQTPVYQLASNMLPQVNGGDAPTWELNFDLPGVGNFGSYTLGPESWVWSACRAIVIVSALIFAFRLVFGGA